MPRAVSIVLVLLGALSASAQERPAAPGGGWTVVQRSATELLRIERRAEHVVASGAERALRGGATGRWVRERAVAPPTAERIEGPECEAGGRATVVRASPTVLYARCEGEVLWRDADGSWARWSSLPYSPAVVVAAVELEPDRALIALADGDTYVLYGNRFRRDAVGLGIVGFAVLGESVFGVTPRAVMRRQLPPPPASFCQVQVQSVLSAEAFRGSGPPSPANQAMRNDPRWQAEEHGESHVQCRYRVELRGRAYAYLHVVSTTPRGVGSPQSLCEGLRAEVEARIRSFTEQCVDLSAGEYYGYRLEPLVR